LINFYLHTKFGDCRFSFTGMISSIEIENGSHDPDHDPFEGDSLSLCWNLT